MTESGRSEAAAVAFKAFESGAWSARAAVYDRVTGAITRRFEPALLDAAGVGLRTRLLDVASGTGHAAAAAAARGAVVTGVDLAEGMVAGARERHPEIEFRRADAESLPFGADSFDAVVAGFLFNHLPRPERAAAEIARVLSPGGRLAATVWAGPTRARLMSMLAESVRAANVPTAAVPPGPDPFRFAEDDQFRSLLLEVGLVDVDVEQLAHVHQAGDADELWEGLLGGSVRGSTLVQSQDRGSRRRIRAEFDRILAEYRHGEGYAIPAAAALARGSRPS